MPGPPVEDISKNCAVAAIPEQLAGLFELFSEVVLFHERVHVAVGDEQVGPSVIVEVQKGGAPFHILRVHRKTSSAGDVIEGVIPEVSIERIRCRWRNWS